MLTVSCSHASPDWTLTGVIFAVVESGEWSDYRIGGDATNGYYAIAPRFGCGKTAKTPDNAIRSLLADNGAHGVTIATAPNPALVPDPSDDCAPYVPVTEQASDATSLYVVTSRSVDGSEWLSRHGWSSDRSDALLMPLADATAIAEREDAKASETRSPDNGVYQIQARLWGGPSVYTLADYESDAQEARELSAQWTEIYGDDQ